jgi:hypothetical protein
MYIYFVGCNKRFIHLHFTLFITVFYHVAPVTSLILTSMRSCNGHVPPIIQEGRARAGQSNSRAGRGKIQLPTVSSHTEWGGGEYSHITDMMSHSLTRTLSVLLSNLHEVVQWTLPSYNPGGTCPRCSEHQPRLEGLNPTPNSFIACKNSNGQWVSK